MFLKLYQSNRTPMADLPSNKGYDNVVNLLRQLNRLGVPSRVIDTDSLGVEAIQKAYSDAVTPSVHKRLGIRRVFGSRRRSGSLFGREVPALLVYEDPESKYPDDVYPHDDWQSKLVTIEEFLYNLQTQLLLERK